MTRQTLLMMSTLTSSYDCTKAGVTFVEVSLSVDLQNLQSSTPDKFLFSFSLDYSVVALYFYSKTSTRKNPGRLYDQCHLPFVKKEGIRPRQQDTIYRGFTFGLSVHLQQVSFLINKVTTSLPPQVIPWMDFLKVPIKLVYLKRRVPDLNLTLEMNCT